MDIINGPTIDVRMEQLRRDVEPYQFSVTNSGSEEPFSIKTKHIYIALPLLTVTILFLVKPNIIMEKNKQDGQLSIDFNKLIMWSIVISSVLVFCLYFYNYKRRNS